MQSAINLLSLINVIHDIRDGFELLNNDCDDAKANNVTNDLSNSQ